MRPPRVLLAALLLVNTTAGAAPYTAPPTLCPAPPKLAPGTLRPDAVTVAFEGTVAVTGDATFEGIEGSVESGLADGADGRVFTVDAVLPVGAGIPAECYELVLFVGELEDDDGTLPSGAGSLCAGHGGHVVVDHTYIEAYPFSCCEMINRSACGIAVVTAANTNVNETTCSYVCPTPHVGLNGPESIPDEVWGYPRPLHSTNTERHGEWDSESELELTYAPERSSLGIMRTMFASLAIFPLVLGAISTVTDKMHKIASASPHLSFATHLLTTLTMLIIVATEK